MNLVRDGNPIAERSPGAPGMKTQGLGGPVSFGR